MVNPLCFATPGVKCLVFKVINRSTPLATAAHRIGASWASMISFHGLTCSMVGSGKISSRRSSHLRRKVGQGSRQFLAQVALSFVQHLIADDELEQSNFSPS